MKEKGTRKAKSEYKPTFGQKLESKRNFKKYSGSSKAGSGGSTISHAHPKSGKTGSSNGKWVTVNGRHLFIEK